MFLSRLIHRTLQREARCSLVAYVILAILPCTILADLLDDAKNVRPALAAKYEAAYAHVEMHTVERIANQSGGSNWTQTCEYFRNGKLLRGQSTTNNAGTSGAQVGRTGAVVAGERCRFEVSRVDPKSRFILADFQPTPDSGATASEKAACGPLLAYGYLDAIKVDDLLNGTASYAHPVSAMEATLDGRRVTKVAVEVKAEGGKLVVWELYFLPKSWAFSGGTQVFSGGVTIEFRIGYEGDNPLRLKSYERWIVGKSTPQIKREHSSVDVTSLEFCNVPESQFRLAAFGLEEPVIGRPKTVSSKLLWVNSLVFGCLGILLAILSVRRLRNRGNPGPQGPKVQG